MAITHKKKFGIYHWDTFDNETILVGEKDTLVEAKDFVQKKYGDRIKPTGADQVDVVNLAGDILEKYSIA